MIELTDAEILILRYLGIGPFVSHGGEWPTLDGLVGRGLLSVKSGPEVSGRWYCITNSGRDARDAAMLAKSEEKPNDPH